MFTEDQVLFFRSFIKSPNYIGSVIPSSRFLANKMVSYAPWEEIKSLAELGSGTGAITSYLSNHVSQDTKVMLFEMDQTMRHKLRTKYPNFTCHSDAARIIHEMKKQNLVQLDCIFSGLPFFNFNTELREVLVEQIHKALKPDGLFIAFQYSLHMKNTLSRKFMIEEISWVPFNMPPAFVYVCRKI